MPEEIFELPEVPDLQYPDTVRRNQYPAECFLKTHREDEVSTTVFTKNDPLDPEERGLTDLVLDAPDQIRNHGVDEDSMNAALLLIGRSPARLAESKTTLDEVVRQLRGKAVTLGLDVDEMSVSLTMEQRDRQRRNPDEEDDKAMEAYLKGFAARFVKMNPGEFAFVSGDVPYDRKKLEEVLGKIGIVIVSEICNVRDPAGKYYLAELDSRREKDETKDGETVKIRRSLAERFIRFISSDGDKKIFKNEVMEQGINLYRLNLAGPPRYYVVKKGEPKQEETVRQWLLRQPLVMKAGVLHFADCKEGGGGSPITYLDIQCGKGRFFWGRDCNCLTKSKRGPNGSDGK